MTWLIELGLNISKIECYILALNFSDNDIPVVTFAFQNFDAYKVLNILI